MDVGVYVVGECEKGKEMSGRKRKGEVCRIFQNQPCSLQMYESGLSKPGRCGLLFSGTHLNEIQIAKNSSRPEKLSA